ncbi:hypothetical protein [Corynebacterium phoceense]|uniref:hypothetical protein n=1 Tax=Corynebacterium phoceense TaxID=1686286 RepID=UPI0018A911F1|nr:hypothetical protein [Corynebacterium phoceense]MBF9011288.1 hypothetical protein [Corynebacterium phoceense]
MSRQNPYSNALAGLWFTHEVTLQGEERRTMRGVTYGPSQTVLASINMQSRTVTTGIAGEETVVAGTLNWDIDGPLPAVGSKVTLPADFGAKTEREVVTARRAYTGTNLTPDHVEVTIV